jgi:hypothetical protein
LKLLAIQLQLSINLVRLSVALAQTLKAALLLALDSIAIPCLRPESKLPMHLPQ